MKSRTNAVIRHDAVLGGHPVIFDDNSFLPQYIGISQFFFLYIVDEGIDAAGLRIGTLSNQQLRAQRRNCGGLHLSTEGSDNKYDKP